MENLNVIAGVLGLHINKENDCYFLHVTPNGTGIICHTLEEVAKELAKAVIRQRKKLRKAYLLPDELSNILSERN